LVYTHSDGHTIRLFLIAKLYCTVAYIYLCQFDSKTGIFVFVNHA